jgi:hypothetical protein
LRGVQIKFGFQSQFETAGQLLEFQVIGDIPSRKDSGHLWLVCRQAPITGQLTLQLQKTGPSGPAPFLRPSRIKGKQVQIFPRTRLQKEARHRPMLFKGLLIEANGFFRNFTVADVKPEIPKAVSAIVTETQAGSSQTFGGESAGEGGLEKLAETIIEGTVPMAAGLNEFDETVFLA